MNQQLSVLTKTKILTGLVLLMLFYFLPYILHAVGCNAFMVTDKKGLILHEIYAWLIPAFMLVYALAVEKQKFMLTDEQNYPYRWYLVNFLKLFFSILFIGWVVFLFVKALGINNHSTVMTKTLAILRANKPMILLVSLTAGISEELLFRGYVFGRLEKLFNKPVVSILVSSALFAVLHIAYGTLSQVLFPFLLGVLFSMHYYKYRNIQILIMCHFFWDFISLLNNAK